MKNKSLTANAMEICMENTVQKVMDFFEKDDGRTFEEKKEDVIKYLENQDDTLLAERLLAVATNDEVGRRFKDRFWKKGIVLRKVQDTDNYASQGLFGKLGAVPNGISEFMLHKEEDIKRCETENIHLIDDKMVDLANKFNVEPRKLLSHVLEYKLVWK